MPVLNLLARRCGKGARLRHMIDQVPLDLCVCVDGGHACCDDSCLCLKGL